MPQLLLPPRLRARHASLWRTIAALCRSGFPVDPYEARVLIADFAREDWPLFERLLPGDRAPVELRLARRFYEFSADRWGSQHGAAWRLRDLHAAMRGRDSGTRRQRCQPPAPPLVNAWRALDAPQRLSLQRFHAEGLVCEWRLATAQTGSICDARRGIVAALVRWLDAALQASPDDHPLAIARALWGDGCHPNTIARRMAMPTGQVDDLRLVAGAEIAAALQRADPRTNTRASMDLPAIFRRAVVLLGDNQAREARELLHSHRLPLQAVIEEDNFELDGDALAAVELRPQILAEAYQILFEETPTVERRAAELRALQFQQNDSLGIGSAFRVLVEDLPAHLVDWERWLPARAVDSAYSKQLFQLPSVAAAGVRAQGLLQFGLVPESFAGIARSLQLWADEVRAGEEVPAFFASDNAGEPTSRDAAGDDPVELRADTMVACVRLSAFVPSQEPLVQALAQWTTEVLGERPRFIPGYEIDWSGGGFVPDGARLLAHHRPELAPEENADLRALWTYRRPLPSARLRYF